MKRSKHKIRLHRSLLVAISSEERIIYKYMFILFKIKLPLVYKCHITATGSSLNDSVFDDKRQLLTAIQALNHSHSQHC